MNSMPTIETVNKVHIHRVQNLFLVVFRFFFLILRRKTLSYAGWPVIAQNILLQVFKLNSKNICSSLETIWNMQLCTHTHSYTHTRTKHPNTLSYRHSATLQLVCANQQHTHLKYLNGKRHLILRILCMRVTCCHGSSLQPCR